MQRSRLRALAVSYCLLALAACGGGGGGNSNLPAQPSATPAPTSTPAPLPQPSAASNSTSITPTASGPTTQALPATGGFGGSITVPQVASGSGSIAVTIATGGDAVLARSRRPDALPGGGYLVELQLTPSQNITLSAAPGFSLDITQYLGAAGITVAQAAAYLQATGTQFYAGIQDDQGTFTTAGPLSLNVSTTAVSISYAGATAPITLHQGMSYTIGIHIGPINAPTATPSSSPTATPSATPTATPAATLTANPANLGLSGTGSGNAQSFTVSGGTAPYAASGYDANTITVATDPKNASGFVVTPVAAGSTSITVKDALGNSVTIPVTVTTMSGVVQ